MSILNYFPFQQMRDKQRAVLLDIESAVKSGYKNIFLEAPTGFGKTPVAIALARKRHLPRHSRDEPDLALHALRRVRRSTR